MIGAGHPGQDCQVRRSHIDHGLATITPAHINVLGPTGSTVGGELGNDRFRTTRRVHPDGVGGARFDPTCRGGQHVRPRQRERPRPGTPPATSRAGHQHCARRQRHRPGACKRRGQIAGEPARQTQPGPGHDNPGRAELARHLHPPALPIGHRRLSEAHKRVRPAATRQRKPARQRQPAPVTQRQHLTWAQPARVRCHRGGLRAPRRYRCGFHHDRARPGDTPAVLSDDHRTHHHLRRAGRSLKRHRRAVHIGGHQSGIRPGHHRPIHPLDRPGAGHTWNTSGKSSSAIQNPHR